MCKLIERPSNPYSPLWALYWEQNPTLRRGVGADGVEDENLDKDKDTDLDKDKEIDKEIDKDKGPSDEEAKLLKEVMTKKGLLKDQGDEIQTLKDQLKKFDGIDLDQVSKLLKSASEAEIKKLEDKGAWDALKTQMVEQQNTEKQALRDQIEALKGSLTGSDSLIKKLTVGQAFDSSNFIGDELTLTSSKARIIYGSNFDVVDGKVVAFDKPQGAEGRTPLVDSEGKGLPFEAAMKKIVDADPDRDHLIKSKKKPGADSETGDGKAIKSTTELTGAERIAAALNKSGK
jgi:hypothetical protein